MSESFSLPLRPSTSQNQSAEDTLPLHIAQINSQYGSFREITAQGLQDEIEALRTSGHMIDEDDKAQSRDDQPTDRREQLFKSRLEILEFAMQGHAEATYALDFVSLLLSKRSRQSEISMSPYLKQRAPPGSLGLDVRKPAEQLPSSKTDIEAVSRGWKLENFGAAADKLLKSASRLEEEVAAETKYWAEVLAIKDKGWKICRLPRERQTLGVKFGFMEATPTFRDKGFAALRRADGGGLILDRGLRASTPRAVRVRVQKDNEIIGSSKLPYPEPQHDDIFETHIRQARDTLYEEELFHEINREARVLLQHSIETRSNLVQFQAGNGQQILLDLAGLNEWESDPDPSAHAQDSLAEAVAQSLRILLSHAHRLNLRRRTQIPPPLTAKKRPNPEYSLLRPPACYLQHRSELQWLCSFFDTLTKTLRDAKVDCDYVASPFITINTVQGPQNPTSPGAKLAPPEELAATFTSPFESVLTGSFVSPLSSFRVRIHTNINQNGFGTEFELLTTLTHLPRFQSAQRFGLRKDLQDRLLYLFTLDIIHIIPPLAGIPQQTSLIPNRNAPSYPEEDEDDLYDATPQTPTTSSNIYLTPWESTFPNMGQLTAYSPRHHRSKKLTVDFSHNQLVIRCFWSGDAQTEFGFEKEAGLVTQAHETSVPEAVVYKWGSDAEGPKVGEPGGAKEDKSLKEVVQFVSREGS